MSLACEQLLGTCSAAERHLRPVGPGVNATSVAEAALMMLLMLARRVPEQLVTFSQRGLGSPLGIELSGKTLGIIGMGAIGAAPCDGSKATAAVPQLCAPPADRAAPRRRQSLASLKLTALPSCA